MLKDQFNYYLENQDELLEKYKDKYIVIKDLKVIGSYNSKEEAYNNTIKEHELGSFLIQLCKPGKDNYTQTFTTRINFK